jgi:hypothetical protein
MAPLAHTQDEILTSVEYDAPLIANGVRCHGGFVDGVYVSPRTAVRTPAIAAWQAALQAQGAPLLEIPRHLVPPQYPSAAQSALLLAEGISAPVVRILTSIAIIEGFGAMIRDQRVPDWRRCVREPLDGTAAAHLAGGLFEAHARDEAGFRDQGGHKQMWEAARDLALDNPSIPPDVLMRLRTGRRGGARQRLFPQLDAGLEDLLTTMGNVLVIEVFAADTFQWAETLLGDAAVSRQPQQAAALVGYIRADEAPHVEYLRTALSELRARTFIDQDGGDLPGQIVVDGLLRRTLEVLTGERPRLQRAEARQDIDAALAGHRDAAGLQRRFAALEEEWQAPEWDGRLVG